MNHYYPYFLQDDGQGNPILKFVPSNVYSTFPQGPWAIGVNTSPGNATAADLTVGGTIAVGLMKPDDFATDTVKLSKTPPTAYIFGPTFIRGKNASLPVQDSNDLNPPQLLIYADTGSALAVKGTSDFDGDTKLTGKWNVEGPTTLKVPAASTDYTLDVDGKIRLSHAITVLEGTGTDPLWKIRGKGPQLNVEEALLTINDKGEVTIHKPLTVIGRVHADDVEATNSITGKTVTADHVTAKEKLTAEKDAEVKGKLTADSLTVTNDATVKGKLTAEKDAEVKGKLTAWDVRVNHLLDADTIKAVNINAYNVTVKNKLWAKRIRSKKIDADSVKAKILEVTKRFYAKRAQIGHHAIMPPAHPLHEPGSHHALNIVGGFIGQKVYGNYHGPGKYIVMGQAPPVGAHGGRYGITIRNGKHFCSLRVVKNGPCILSWGNHNRLRFRYEGSRWPTKNGKHKFVTRDVVSIDRRGDVLVFGGITAAAYGANCDERFKEDIKPVEGALDKVLSLRGVSYFFREEMLGGYTCSIPNDEDGADEESNDDESEAFEMEATLVPERRPRMGLIAQEVEKVCPEMISTDEQGYKVLDTTQLNPLLLEAIKEQQRLIEAQNRRIEALERALLSKH